MIKIISVITSSSETTLAEFVVKRFNNCVGCESIEDTLQFNFISDENESEIDTLLLNLETEVLKDTQVKEL